MRKVIPAAMLATFLMSVASVSQAQTFYEYAAQCGSPQPSVRIEACTKLIGDGEVPATDLPKIYSNRGLAYSELGQLTLAIADFNRAIENSPENARAYSNRGLAYDQLGQVQQALSDFDTAIRFDPKNANYYNNRCYVRSKMGQAAQGIGDCKQAIKIAPGDAKLLDTLGYANFRLGDYQKAVDAYNAALKISPDLAESLYGRGVAKEQLKSSNGVNDIGAAIELDRTIAQRMEKIGVAVIK
jgi:tetratricopeptide (TPR) repeat protein